MAKINWATRKDNLYIQDKSYQGPASTDLLKALGSH